jgi:hypothetical protein
MLLHHRSKERKRKTDIGSLVTSSFGPHTAHSHHQTTLAQDPNVQLHMYHSLNILPSVSEEQLMGVSMSVSWSDIFFQQSSIVL